MSQSDQPAGVAVDRGVSWQRPRPPLLRLCMLKWTCDAWPENGAGVYQIIGFDALDTKQESWTLRRLMPSDLAQPVGQVITIWRAQYERGGVEVWRGGKDLCDPRFSMPANSYYTTPSQ